MGVHVGRAPGAPAASAGARLDLAMDIVGKVNTRDAPDPAPPRQKKTGLAVWPHAPAGKLLRARADGRAPRG